MVSLLRFPPSSRPVTRPIRPTLRLLPLALALAACGGDGGTTPDPEPQPTFRSAPESAPRELILGTTVQGEGINTVGDVDEFGFTAPAGGMVAISVKAQNGGQILAVAVVDSATDAQVAAGVAYGAADFTDIIRADVGPGRWLLRVRLDASSVTGPYTLTVYPVNPHPEQGDSVLTPGVWAHGDMSPYYDVDDFLFDGVAGQEVNLFGQVVDGGGGSYKLRLRGPGPVQGPWMVEEPVETHFPGATGIVRLPATGRYRVRMMSHPAFPAGAHPYRLMVYPIVRTPEGVPAALVSGQTIREPLQMPEDVDEYTFTAAAGELLRLNFVSENPHENPVVEVHETGTGERLNVRFTRFAAPRAGTYRVTVSRPSLTLQPVPEPLYYRMELVRIDPAPEGVPAAIALGDTVAEALDPAGDVDEYTLSGTSGTEVVVLAEAPAYASVDLHRADTGERLARVQSYRTEPGLSRHASPRFRLPVTGGYRVRVWHDEQAALRRTAGGTASDEAISPAYRFAVVPISRGPEGRPAAFAIGDTVTGELRPKHDVDIYTFTAQAGDRLVLWGERLYWTPPVEPVTIFLTREDEPEALAYIFTAYPGLGQEEFTAPATGTYRVVVWPANGGGLQEENAVEGEYEGGYRFSVQRAP
jgi:hypothetical protein